MNPLLEEIVSAYAEFGVAGVSSERRLRGPEERHQEDRAFDTEVSRVKEVAARLEERLANQTFRGEVIMALKLFYAWRADPERQQICHELTARRYAGRWSEQQRKYYEEASRKLQHWRDYFLSFTNHNPTEGEVMYVNNRHRQLIRVGLGRQPRRAESIGENMLAHLLRYLFSHAALDGYFYPKHRGARDVQETLRREADSAFVFVQLLQETMFEKWPNYCMAEFVAASEDPSRPLIFIMTVPLERFIERERVKIELQDWYDAIQKPDIVELEPAGDRARAEALLDEIERRVVEPVKEARMNLFTDVPV